MGKTLSAQSERLSLVMSPHNFVFANRPPTFRKRGQRVACVGIATTFGATMLAGIGLPAANAALTSPINLPGGANVQINGSGEDDHSGHSVSGIGDVNGDNIDDVIIGAPLASNNDRDISGSTYIVYGRANPGTPVDLSSLNPATTGLRIDGATADSYSGWSVSGAGDVNGDGLNDVVIGAPFDSADEYWAGSSYIIYGQPNNQATNIDLATPLVPSSTGFKIDGTDARSWNGWSVSGAGDVNGDGKDDVIVGADGDDSLGRNGNGTAYIIYGKANGAADNIDLGTPLVPTSTGFAVRGAADGDGTGESVSSAGDVNGDGIADLVVGAPRTYSNFFAGTTYVVYGRPSADANNIDLDDGLDPANTGFLVTGVDVLELSGYSVSGAGDVNGDNFDDVVIGAPTAAFEEPTQSGSAYVVYGKPNGSAANVALADTPLNPASTGWKITGAEIGDNAGNAVSAAGDINDDGLDDVLVGAWHSSNNGLDEAGSSYVLYGAADQNASNIDLATPLNSATTGIQFDGGAEHDHVGAAVSGAFDMNGDGASDMLIGAPYAESNAEHSGSSYVVFGQLKPTPAPAAQVPLRNCVKVPVALAKNSKTKLTKPRCKTNAGQSVRVTAKAVSKRGDIRTFKLIRKKNGKTFIKTFQTRTKVTIKWKAPATSGYKKYKLKQTFKIGKKAKRQLSLPTPENRSSPGAKSWAPHEHLQGPRLRRALARK